MKSNTLIGVSLLLAIVFAGSAQAARARESVYMTADNGAGTNLFGTLNLKTGKFTEIAQTTPLFYALTTGPEGRLYGADVNTGTLFTISPSGVTTPYGNITAPGYQYSGASFYGFFGLVYGRSKDQFFAVNVDPLQVSLDEIAKHGAKQTDIGMIEGPNTGVFFGGSLAFGPFGKLYFDFIPATGPQLYTIDESTGAPTPVGSGLGTDILTLFSDGDRLFGIDTDTTTGIGIYVIDRKTGVATPTGVIVTGLPNTNDFYVDTAAFSPHDHDCEGR